MTSTGNSTDGSDSSPADSQIKFGTTGVNQINLEIPEGYTATYSINGGKQKTYKGKFDLPVGENQIAVVLFDEKGKIVEERSFTVKVDKPIAKKIKTVKKGKRFTMKITNKEAASRIVYKTTNKKVANVSKSGSIKAKSKGKAVIKAKLVIAGEVHIVKTKIKVK